MTDETIRKTVIITGSSKGIGRAIAFKLALLSYNIVLNYGSDEESAQESLFLCQRFTPHVILIWANVACKAEVERLIDGTYKHSVQWMCSSIMPD